MGNFEKEEEEIIIDVNIIVNSLSLLGSLFILVAFCSFKQLRVYAFKLVAMLSLADFFQSLGMLIGPMHNGDKMCYAQALIISYFSVVSICCTMVIAWTLYSAIILQTPNIEARFTRNMLFAYGLPLIGTIIPLFSGSYGEADGFCWVMSDDAKDMIIGILQFYVPLWIAFGFNTYCYFRVYRVINVLLQNLEGRKDDDRYRKLKLIKRLRFYPIILVFCWTAGTIHRLYSLANPEEPLLWMAILTILFGSLQGLLNAIVYGFSGPVKEVIKDACFPCFPNLLDSKLDYVHSPSTIERAEPNNAI